MHPDIKKPEPMVRAKSFTAPTTGAPDATPAPKVPTRTIHKTDTAAQLPTPDSHARATHLAVYVSSVADPTKKTPEQATPTTTSSHPPAAGHI